MSDDDQKLRVRRVGRDGRRRYDPDSKARLVAACLQPGVSMSGLALAHGINANLAQVGQGCQGVWFACGICKVGVYPSRRSRLQCTNEEWGVGYAGCVWCRPTDSTGEDGPSASIFQSERFAAERGEVNAGMR